MGRCVVKVCRICFAMDCELNLLSKNMELYKGYEAITGFMISAESIQAVIKESYCHSNIEQTEEEKILGEVKIEIKREDNPIDDLAKQLLDDIETECMHGGADDVLVGDGPQMSVESILAVVRREHNYCDNRIHSEEDTILRDLQIEIKREDNPVDATATENDEVKTRRKKYRPDRRADDLVGDEAIAPCVTEMIPIVKDEENEGTAYNEKPIQNVKLSCDLCGYENDNEIQFFTHLKAHANSVHHNDDDKMESKEMKTAPVQRSRKQHPCNICGKIFSRRCYLLNHRLIHPGVKAFTCEICQKSFGRESFLKTHVLKHEETFSCDVCQKSFVNKYYLQTHKLIHSVNRPFSCDLCKKSFRRKGDIRVHMLIHTGVKKHTCKICRKSFRLKFSLNYHMLTHSSDKPYSCDVCGNTFRTKANLRKHRKIHNKDK